MFNNPIVLAGMVFVAFICLGGIVALLFTGERNRLDERINDLAGSAPQPLSEREAVKAASKRALPAIGAYLAASADEKEKTQLKARLIQAGFYNPSAPAVFMGVKAMCVFGPLATGVLLYPAMPSGRGIIALGAGLFLAILGMLAPSFWLDSKKKARQTSLRRALPDALDVIVICVEGGLSLPAALQRVADEMRVAHPLLAFELNICQREIQLGKNTGTALKDFAVRSDLDDVRSLAAVIAQAEKFGSSMAKALRIHAETLRLKRAQKAEEMAAKAGTKILFPTLLFIFPAIFVVILGPAFFDILEMFGKMNK